MEADNKNKLIKLHQTLQDILDIVVVICEKYRLKYYLFYGTLLGAERHQGFIPWDDDLDITMPRDDYEKFLEIAEHELPKPYHIHHIGNDSRYLNMFAKVKKHGTVFRETWMDENYKYPEVFIDIFPIDITSKETSISLLIRKRLYLLLSMSIRRKFERWDWSCLKGTANKFFASFFKTSTLYNMAKKLATYESKKENLNYYYIDYNDNLKKAWEIDKFEPSKKIIFEGKLYNAPLHSECILEDMYNDWQVIPPKEKQITHMPVELIC